MKIKEYISKKLTDFLILCESNNIKELYAFGSSTNENFDEIHSDVDLLIEIENTDPIEKGETLLKIWDSLEFFFQRKVDLLTLSSIKNPILRKNIEKSKILIYDGKKRKVSI